MGVSNVDELFKFFFDFFVVHCFDVCLSLLFLLVIIVFVCYCCFCLLLLLPWFLRLFLHHYLLHLITPGEASETFFIQIQRCVFLSPPKHPFTGSEWDYVILSLVRSLSKDEIDPEPSLSWLREHLGFLTDEHQMNVGLTRARKGLCIIGMYTKILHYLINLLLASLSFCLFSP